MPVGGGTLRFDLSTSRSAVTREMLQVRVRMTARAFDAGTELVAANVTADGAALEVDVGALAQANAEARARLEAGPEGAVMYLRSMSAARLSLDRAASAFGVRLAKGILPRRESFVAYVMASGRDQALGALKFCLPGTLRPALSTVMDDPGLVDALLAPEQQSLWSMLAARELTLARLRMRGPQAKYGARLARHRREFGYLLAEDVDFRAHEGVEAIDTRLASLGAGGRDALAAERRVLARALAEDRAQKVHARRVFAERVKSTRDSAILVSHVLLARALAAHEDLNRRGKMRFLRDLRDLADLSGVDLEGDGLVAFAAACHGAPVDIRRPVLRST